MSKLSRPTSVWPSIRPRPPFSIAGLPLRVRTNGRTAVLHITS
jgi:hypothetical protein